jgi:hypothetical protein
MRFALASVAALLLARMAPAQVPSVPAHPAAGVVGFEGAYGPLPGALGFFFSSPTTSWILGIDRATTERLAGTQLVRTTSTGFRVGVRKWPREMAGPFRIYVGTGLSSTDADLYQSEPGTDFAYGELGALVFLGLHFSLNASGELSIAYRDDDASVQVGRETSTPRVFARGARMRVGAAVYLF